MGNPKHARRKYSRPRKPWDRKRIVEEGTIKEQFGTKSKRELWRLEEILRKKRHSARRLLALPLEERIKREAELVASLNKIGLLEEKATLDDVLTLNLKELLERRLQTIVYRKGLANTPKQARQFIVHGHIALNGKKITRPSYIVRKGEDAKISYYGKPMEIAAKKTKEEIKKEFAAIKKEVAEVAQEQETTEQATEGEEAIEETPTAAVEEKVN